MAGLQDCLNGTSAPRERYRLTSYVKLQIWSKTRRKTLNERRKSLNDAYNSLIQLNYFSMLPSFAPLLFSHILSILSEISYNGDP